RSAFESGLYAVYALIYAPVPRSTTSRAVPENGHYVVYAPSRRRAQKVARLNSMAVVYEHETDASENCVTKYGKWEESRLAACRSPGSDGTAKRIDEIWTARRSPGRDVPRTKAQRHRRWAERRTSPGGGPSRGPRDRSSPVSAGTDRHPMGLARGFALAVVSFIDFYTAKSLSLVAYVHPHQPPLLQPLKPPFTPASPTRF